MNKITTEELENKLKISKNTCIHCPTIKLAIQMSNIFHQLGIKWCHETHYIPCINWDKHKEGTTYYPFDGEFSSLEFARVTGYKIINAKEFIALHTVKEKYNLENYTPKGELQGFPKEIIARMLDCQEEQGNPRDISVFERDRKAGQRVKGFIWDKTKEGKFFWNEVIYTGNFDVFFEKYPKQGNHDNPQDFRVGDNVIDIILDLKGKITNVKSNGNLEIQFEGESSITEYNLKIEKRPSLLHYRNDYDYDVIDFNNLPKRQEPKRWRAEKGETYYFFTSNFEVEKYYDHNDYNDNKAYDSGNYFKTKEEAQEVEDKLNKYFQELINPNKELWQKK